MIRCGRRRYDAAPKGIAPVRAEEGETRMTEVGWFVYIVECADDTLYAGVTTDAAARVAKHNDGSGAKYTRTRRPVELVYVEPASDRGAALAREHAIKKMSAADKRSLVASTSNGVKALVTPSLKR